MSKESEEKFELSSVIVMTRPESVQSVKSTLEQMAGVEVHAATDEGKLIVTIDGDGRSKGMADTIYSFQEIDGVISADLIYHYNDFNNDSAEKEKSL